MVLTHFLKRHKEFMRNVATMMTGKSVAAGIALITMPIISRLFTPSDFGVAAVFLSLGIFISNVGVLRYEMALVLPKLETEALLLIAFTYRLLFGVCLVLWILIFCYELTDTRVELLESMGVWLWLLPLGVLLLAMVHIQEHWLSRTKSFRVVAASMVVGTSVTGGMRIGFGLTSGSSVIGLIGGHMLGQICRLAVQKTASREGLKAAFQRLSWSQLREVAIRYSDFPKLNAPAALLTGASQQLPVILFGLLFSPAVVGFYSMAVRLSQAPIVLVSRSVSRVYLQKAAEIVNRGKSLRFAFLMATGSLALFGAIPVMMLWSFGEPLVAWLLGDSWSDAGRYLEILSPWLFIIWVTAPANPVFVVLRRQRLWLTLQIATTAVRLGTFVVAWSIAATPEWTLGAFVVATVFGNLMIIIAALIVVHRHRGSLPTATN